MLLGGNGGEVGVVLRNESAAIYKVYQCEVKGRKRAEECNVITKVRDG